MSPRLVAILCPSMENGKWQPKHVLLILGSIPLRHKIPDYIVLECVISPLVDRFEFPIWRFPESWGDQFSSISGIFRSQKPSIVGYPHDSWKPSYNYRSSTFYRYVPSINIKQNMVSILGYPHDYGNPHVSSRSPTKTTAVWKGSCLSNVTGSMNSPGPCGGHVADVARPEGGPSMGVFTQAQHVLNHVEGLKNIGGSINGGTQKK